MKIESINVRLNTNARYQFTNYRALFSFIKYNDHTEAVVGSFKYKNKTQKSEYAYCQIFSIAAKRKLRAFVAFS